MASNFKAEVEMKSPADKVWSNVKEFGIVFPKVLPHICEKVDVLEGDGKAVGSIILCALKSDFVSTIKQRIDIVDEEKKIRSYSFIGGEILKYYKNYKGIVYVSSKGNGALVKYSAEFEKANEEFPHPDFFKDFIVKIFEELDVYLLRA